ncbi:MAG: LacI family DNA-binding transcriptional regulator [Acholeplasmataceae bacterium]|nr:LacI family DNA-binding transcriptional regulator [Acholeplasmataceae bacterium]
MPTIKDVAKLAGVSISTASYALNNLPNVHPDTRKRILEAAETLKYYPNGIARNLKTKRTGSIGVFIYGFAGPIFSDVLEGIRQKLQENNFNIVVSSGKSSANMLKERQIDGAIIFDNELSDDVLINYANYGLPLYVLDRNLDGKNIYSSLIDNEGLVYSFIKDMIKKGYKDFGYLSGPKVAFNNNHRYDGFVAALKDEKISHHEHYDCDFTIQGGYLVGKALAKEKNRPRFIYCANDESAIGFMQALREENIRVPEDIAVAGFDNIYLGEYITPKLTTIGIDHVLWGKEVAGAILDILQNNKIRNIGHPKGSVILRESC